MFRPMLAFSLVATASVALAATGSEPNAQIVPGAFIIEFEDSANSNQLRVQAEVEYETRVELDFELFRGVSIQLDNATSAEERAAQLASLPAVKNIWPVTVIERPQFSQSGVQNSTTHSRNARRNLHSRQNNGSSDAQGPLVMAQVDKLHHEGITGKGIRIASVDDGIDYSHPALGGCFGEGCLVVSGHDFVGDDYTGSNEPIPDEDPADSCNQFSSSGSGTFLAGIIAARDNEQNIRGVAPDVTLSDYRIWGCDGSTTIDIAIAAFNRAYEDGADIITSVLGVTNGWPSAPLSVAVSRIVEKGVPCVLSAGDDTSALFLPSSPADGKGATSVASFVNTKAIRSYSEGTYTVNESPSVRFPWQWAFPEFFDNVPRSLWVTGYDLNNDEDACTPLPDDTPDLSDFIVLVREGNCGIETQAFNVAEKGARYFVQYTTGNTLYWFNVENVVGLEGAAMVYRETGEAWVKALEAGEDVKVQLDDHLFAPTYIVYEDNDFDGGAISPSTAWGPTFDMDIKPQFGAPGYDVMSTWPLNRGGFANGAVSWIGAGFAAASYALVAEARGIKPEPDLFESLLSSTAKAQLYSSWDGWRNWLAPVARQGAGLIQVYDAAFSNAFLSPSGISFNDTDHFAGTLDFSITSSSAEEVTYEVSHVPARSFVAFQYAGQFAAPPEDRPEHAELAFSNSNVIIAPGDSATVSVTPSPPLGDNLYWSGYITVNGSDGSSLALPYQGISGSLYDASGEVSVRISEASYRDAPPVWENTTFVLPAPGEDWNPDGPVLALHLNMLLGSSQAKVEIMPVGGNSTGEIIGQIADSPARYLRRDHHVWLWTGLLDSGHYAPAGAYSVVFKVLRIFGDADSEDDWVIRESNMFQIRYANSNTHEVPIN